MEFEVQENQGNNSIQGIINLQPQVNQVNQVQSQQQEIQIKQTDIQVSSTLEESVAVTLLRDLRQIGVKLRCVLVPTMSTDNARELRNWDLWGPLVFCLMLALTLSLSGNNDDGPGIFATIFVLIWVGSFVVTLNAQLLGGKVSFFQSVCVLGYCVFPINLGALFTLFFQFFYLKMFLVIGCFLWSTYSAVGFMKLLIPEQKRILALYPVILFYLFLSWFALIV
ncbi:unnamed protein product [Paramecium octaurelia]|uniref:Protein YIPF n=1 Tax=Paramecium octaurelia TaxID=43137 RepID=A0A8S1S1B9_PAROT|nr:unnamed protein product [Paramecium octaurelia]